MYGLVNRAIEELTISVSDTGTWEDIKQRAGVDTTKFLSMEPYPDEITYRLVAAASERLDMPAEELLHAFGRHWILFTAKQGYGSLIDSAGSTLKEFLNNLDMMHAQIAAALPDLNPPSFVTETTDCPNVMVLHYHSTREGLAPMVMGLLEGLSLKFETPLRVDHVLRRGMDSNYDAFRLHFQDMG